MIPYITREQATKLDSLMEDHFHVTIRMMMEQAGYRLAEFIRSVDRKNRPVIICAGKGNNGGDGISCARHLANFGYSPKIFLATVPVVGPGSAFLDIAVEMGIPLFDKLGDLEEELEGCGTIIDCLLGYNLKGEPRPPYDEVIRMMNRANKPIISCDLPSGVDPDRGIIHEAYVKATHILHLSLPKAGCEGLEAEQHVADIGVPMQLYPMIGLPEENHFEKASIIRI